VQEGPGAIEITPADSLWKACRSGLLGDHFQPKHCAITALESISPGSSRSRPRAAPKNVSRAPVGGSCRGRSGHVFLRGSKPRLPSATPEAGWSGVDPPILADPLVGAKKPVGAASWSSCLPRWGQKPHDFSLVNRERTVAHGQDRAELLLRLWALRSSKAWNPFRPSRDRRPSTPARSVSGLSERAVFMRSRSRSFATRQVFAKPGNPIRRQGILGRVFNVQCPSDLPGEDLGRGGHGKVGRRRPPRP